METLMQDLRYGIRMLRARPGFAAMAVLILALGIGVNSAIFSIVNAVLLRPLSYPDPDRLVIVLETNPQKGTGRLFISAADFNEWRNQVQSFEDMAAIMFTRFRLTEVDAPEEVSGTRASPSLFPMLGVKAAIGRTFLSEDEQPASSPVALLGHEYWRTRMGADSNVIGKSVTLNGKAHTIVGVLPASFKENFQMFPRQSQVWTPIVLSAEEMNRHGPGGMKVMARLKKGATIAQAQAEMETIAARLEHEHPKTNTGIGAAVYPLHEEVVGHTRQTFIILIAAVGFVLLIACANVANLLLGRAVEREKEIAIRTALGAGRRRVIRQLLTESVLLSLAGGVLGLLLALWSIEAVIPLIPSDIPRADEIRIDGQALGFTLAISLLSGIFFGLAPALQTSRLDLIKTLKDTGRRTASGRRSRYLRNALVVSQISLTLVLLVGAGLMVNSFIRLYRVDPGFNIENMLTMYVSLPRSKGEDVNQWSAFFGQLTERAKSMPEVQDAATVMPLPLSDSAFGATIEIEGRARSSPEEKLNANYAMVSSNYFQVMGIHLLSGRYFTDDDKADTTPVVIINESMARRFWPGDEPLGKRFIFKGDPRNEKLFQVVGVVADSRSRLNAEPMPQFYLLHLQYPSPSMCLVTRTVNDPLSLAGPMREEVRAMDKNQPVGSIATMEELWSRWTVKPRFYTLLFGVFAAAALVLATVGIYGVMSYSVAQRTHEIGIRMALGAQAGDVLKLILKHGIILTLIGLIIGLAGAFMLARLLATFLYEVSATDPATFAVISLILAGVALGACAVPARRATRVDPMVALRYE